MCWWHAPCQCEITNTLFAILLFRIFFHSIEMMRTDLTAWFLVMAWYLILQQFSCINSKVYGKELPLNSVSFPDDSDWYFPLFVFVSINVNFYSWCKNVLSSGILKLKQCMVFMWAHQIIILYAGPSNKYSMKYGSSGSWSAWSLKTSCNFITWVMLVTICMY